MENAYLECLAYELSKQELKVEKQKALPLIYDSVKFEVGYRVDLIIEQQLIIELKVVEELNDIHLAQLLTYLRLSKCKLGLLMNFNTLLFRELVLSEFFLAQGTQRKAQGANYGITIDDIHKEIFLRVTVRNKNGKEKAINSVAHWVLNIEAKIESLQAIDLSGALVSYNEKSIDIKLPSGSTKSSLKVKYSLSLGAKMTGKTCCEFVGDFTNPVTLTIIAEEGTISAFFDIAIRFT